MTRPSPSARRRAWRTTVAALVCALLLPSASIAATFTSEVRRIDARDDGVVDVWSTRRATVRLMPDRYRVRFFVHGDLGPDWYVFVLIDSRGGRRAEVKLTAWEDLGDNGCKANRLFDGPVPVRCGREVISVSAETKLWWGVPRRVLAPTKRIRWRVVSHFPDDVQHLGDDHAPDVGWYP
jgi:hypothetical protein